MRRLLLAWIFVSMWVTTIAQPSSKDYPVIGQQIPEFKLTNVHFYSRNTFDPREVKDKWIIMDFWYKGCTACVQSFPKLNQLQKEFKSNIQFFLVAKNDEKNNANIEKIYDRYKKQMSLDLPCAFDTVLFNQFGIYGAPHVVVIDPKKNVYAVTYGDFITHENLEALVNDKRPTFKFKQGLRDDYKDARETFRSDKTVQWEYSKIDSGVLCRSVLSSYNGEYSGGYYIQDASNGFFYIVRANLFQLYSIALFGAAEWPRGDFYASHWMAPLLEITDSSRFERNLKSNEYEGFYNYSLKVPREKATKEYMKEVMQHDLKNYFGYEIVIETRMMPYWRLTATDEAIEKIVSKGDLHKSELEASYVDVRRGSIENVLTNIERFNRNMYYPYTTDYMVFLDETDIRKKIDIKLNVAMTDLEGVAKALRKYGLILEKSKKEFKVLVIRDPKPVK